ncbi:MAG: ABC transporter ATP-binding protein [Spirochaetia bacterium]|jgi:oligopeptide/dipeptide ABC transporter ATP-binding protein|nr:ABC transporter ATP-binding protein [Spirochaetia bacterium]
MAEKKILLEVKGLKTCFPLKTETVHAVNGVSFVIYEGDTFGLVGESGCGKSQTLYSILRLLKKPGVIQGGSIIYKGRDLVSLPEKEMQQVRGKEIAQIFQEPMTALNPVLTIRKQLFESFEHTPMTKKQKEAHAVELLRMVGIPSPEKRLNEYPHQFSGGMRQRAMIAIALGEKPRLLLADEPTTALDVTIQDQILTLINDLKEKLGMSMILVTHDLGVVAQMCNRVAVMYAGLIMESTDAITLFSKPRHPYTKALMSSIPNGSGKKLDTISGTPPNLAADIIGCPFAPRCRYAVDTCRQVLPDLCEIEPGHMTRCHRLDVVAGFDGLIPVEEKT